MGKRIEAIYQNGVLRPLEPLDLPEGSIVKIRILEILGDADEFIKNIEKDLSEIDADELKNLEEGLKNNRI
jgi:predicted DNA-binding antitoxin AbrB/MazE fold protein